MASVTYQFDEFRVDPARRELRRGDEKCELPLRAFQCFLYLLENRDRAVSHDELIDQVWGGAHMSDGVVAQAILSARRALDDTVQEPRFIDTVRGFGYRWAAPVDVEAVENVEPPVETPTAAPTSNVRPRWLWTALASLAFAALAAGAFYLQRHSNPGDTDVPHTPRGEGEIALLLPVTVEDDPDHAWIRLGLMDLIALRLREAGQAMVPSETVIALTSGSAEEPDEDGIKRLTETTGAHLVLAGRAQATGARWMVSLHTIHGARPPLTAYGEATDVLEAARAVADQMAVSLGLTPVPDQDTHPGLAMLLHKTSAAILAQQMDVARDLIESADPKLRAESRIRLRSAWIEVYSRHLDTAHAAFTSLLEEPEFQRDPKLKSHALYGLSAVQYERADYDAMATTLEEAVPLLDSQDDPNLFGRVQTSVGIVAAHRGDLDAARMFFARARRAHKGTGHATELAALDNNLGVLLALKGRFVEALDHLESAANTNAALGNVGSELRDRANMIEVLLGLLEPRTALALEPRLAELIGQSANPELIALGNTARTAVFAANGRSEMAESLLNDVLNLVEARDDLYLNTAWTWASLLSAEQLVREGDLQRAAPIATAIVERAPTQDSVQLDDYLGRAWLILLRAHLRDRDLTAAAEVIAAMEDWAERSLIQAPTFYVTLAKAELAALDGQIAAVETHYERALSLTDPGQMPMRLLQVAETYVPWLLDMQPDHALLVADRLDRYATQDYDAALLQLRVYHALGPPSAWRVALNRAQSLSGERQIPPELLDAPDPLSG